MILDLFRRTGLPRIHELLCGSDRFPFPVCVVKNLDLSSGCISWATGKTPSFPIPNPLTYEVDGEPPLDDWAVTGYNEFLISEQFLRVLEGLSVKMSVYPSTVFHGDVVVTDRFFTVNIESLCMSLDHRRSRFSKGRYSAGGDNGILRRPVIKAAKLPPSCHLFRLGESPVHLYVSHEFRTVAAQASLKGVRFSEIPVRR